MVSTAAHGWKPHPHAPQYLWSLWVFREGQGSATRTPSGVVPRHEMCRSAWSSGGSVLVNLDFRAPSSDQARFHRGATAWAAADRAASTRKTSSGMARCFRVRGTSTDRGSLAIAAGAETSATAFSEYFTRRSTLSRVEAPPSRQQASHAGRSRDVDHPSNWFR